MRGGALGLAITVLVFGFAGPASADNFTVSVLFGANAPITCADGGACDGSSLPGVISFNTIVGTTSVTAIGTAQPQSGPLVFDLGYVLSTGPLGAGTSIVIQISENNLTGTNVNWSGAVGGTNDQGGGTTTTAQAWANTNNVLFAHGLAANICGPLTASNPGGFSMACTGGPTTGTFSLTEQITLTTLAGSHLASGNFELAGTAVPEPATLLLVGSGLTGLGILRRRWGKFRLGR